MFQSCVQVYAILSINTSFEISLLYFCNCKNFPRRSVVVVWRFLYQNFFKAAKEFTPS